MGWTARQQAMLRALGLQLWQRPATAAAEVPPAQSRQVAPSPTSPTNPARPASPISPSIAPASGQAVVSMPRPSLPVAGRPAAAPAEAAPALALTASQRGDVAALDWPALRQAVATCTACGLCQSRTQAVFGSGAQKAHWLVVGEAPGEQEDLQGRPFVGPAGELLGHMLAALHLTREDSACTDGPGADPTAAGQTPPPTQPQRQVFVVNTVKCRPPRNRNPTTEELAACEPFLLRQIELLQPRIILALGVFAIQALLRSDEPVGKLRGRVHRYQGVPVVVSYHPAYLLRQPMEKARAWEDLCLAADTAEALAGTDSTGAVDAPRPASSGG